VLILRLKRCERALAGGRLDEAMKLLLPANARAHRRGQELLDLLVAALVDRGRGHLAEGRLGPADADWHAAASLAGNTPPVAQLRASIDQVMADRERVSDDRRRAKCAVDAFVRQGQFTTLAHNVAEARAGLDAAGTGAIVADIDVTRSALARLATDVAAALAQDDWESAVDRISTAGSALGAEARVQQLKREVAGRAADEAGRLIDSGRLEEAASVLRRVAALGSGLGEIESLRRGLDQCQIASQYVRAARFRDAREVLERLATAWPGARWITAASEELRPRVRGDRNRAQRHAGDVGRRRRDGRVSGDGCGAGAATCCCNFWRASGVVAGAGRAVADSFPRAGSSSMLMAPAATSCCREVRLRSDR